MSDDRLKVIVYQYLFYRGDLYKANAELATVKLQRCKCLSASEYQKIYKDLLTNEIFDTITTDLLNLIK